MAFISEGARRAVTALASATSANGTAHNGAALPTNQIEPGTLSVLCSTTIVTGSVVATWKGQVSLDNSTWVDFKTYVNTAPTTVTATADIVINVDRSISAWPYFRIVGTLSGATTAGGDLTAATYRFLAYDELS